MESHRTMSIVPATICNRRQLQSKILFAFVVGCFCGFSISFTVNSCHQPDESTIAGTLKHGSVVHINDVPNRPTSHTDDKGRPITKQQLIKPFTVPNLAGCSVATLLPKQRIELHQHASMHEFFYILEGNLLGQTASGSVFQLKPGSFVHVVSGEQHSFWNDAQEPSKMFFCGVTTGPNFRYI